MSGIGGFSSSTSGGGFTLQTVSDSLGQQMETTESQMENFMSTMNPNDMNDLMQMQMYMIEWETTVQTQSSVYKGIGDTLKSVANNVAS